MNISQNLGKIRYMMVFFGMSFRLHLGSVRGFIQGFISFGGYLFKMFADLYSQFLYIVMFHELFFSGSYSLLYRRCHLKLKVSFKVYGLRFPYGRRISLWFLDLKEYSIEVFFKMSLKASLGFHIELLQGSLRVHLGFARGFIGDSGRFPRRGTKVSLKCHVGCLEGFTQGFVRFFRLWFRVHFKS